MNRLLILPVLLLTLLIGNFFTKTAVAESVHHIIKSVDIFEDIKIKIVDIFEDEKWKVVGACSNPPSLNVKIVEIFEDKKVCVSGANDLDDETLKLLGLID